MKLKIILLLGGITAGMFSAAPLATAAPSTASGSAATCWKCLSNECRNYGPMPDPWYADCFDFGSFCVEDGECPKALADLDITPAGLVNGKVVGTFVAENGTVEERTCSGALIAVRKPPTVLKAETDALLNITF
jgi:hypothetical protein